MSKGSASLAGELSRPLDFSPVKSEPMEPLLVLGTKAMSYVSLIDTWRVDANDVFKSPERLSRKLKEKQSIRLSSPIEISSEDEGYTPKASSLGRAVGQSK